MIGLRNKKITVQRKARTHVGAGEYVWNFADIATERGRIRPARGTDKIAGSQAQGEVTHVAYLRAKADVSLGDHLVQSDLTVKILTVRNPAGADHHLEVDCEEVQRGK